MKKLVLSIISTLLLASTSAQAVIVGRELWQHPNSKIVELFSDVHAEYFQKTDGDGEEYIDQEELLISNQVYKKAIKQQQDIIKYAKLFGDKAHIFVEDALSFKIKNKIKTSSRLTKLGLKLGVLKVTISNSRDSLGYLHILCKKNGISSTNIECRDKIGTRYFLRYGNKSITADDSNPALEAFYKKLLTVKRETIVLAGKERTFSTYDDPYATAQMDIMVIQRINNYTHNKEPEFISKNRLFIVAGASHTGNYAQALALMGYKRVDKKTKLHPETEKIIAMSDCSKLEEIIQRYIQQYFCLIPESTAIENDMWAGAFLVTHPLDIAQIIEEERKELAAVPVAVATPAETKESAAARATTPPVVVTPAIRARL